MARTKRPADYHTKNIWESCGKCGGARPGAGYIPEFSHRLGGVCFDCNGKGGKYVSQAQIDRREADRARRAAKREAEFAATQNARDAFKAEHPDVFAWMEAATNGEKPNSFAASLHESFLRNTINGRPALSDKQLAAAQKSITKDAEYAAQREAERATATPVPSGRMVVTGEILSIRTQENAYGNVQTKVLVREERGFKIWGTLPDTIATAIYDAWYDAEEKEVGADFWAGNYGSDYWHKAAKGRKVTFTARLEASEDDETFGYYTRPTKAALIDN